MSENKVTWAQIEEFIQTKFDKSADLNAILFLIGMRELGENRLVFSKEEKVKLMHLAVCRVFSSSGYYMYKGRDDEGWPSWENVQKLPPLSSFEQETLMRQHIIEYFEAEEILGG
jgi:hypothetical protein